MAINKSRNPAEASLVLVVFGIPFALVGLGVLLWGLSMIRDHYRMKSWQKAPATITQVQFDERRGSKGGRTWIVTGSYKYVWEGRPYRGNRIVVESGSTSEHAFWRGLYDDLERARKERKTYDILVNPADPTESIVVNRFSITMMILPCFGLVFLIAGLGIMRHGYNEYRQAGRSTAQAERFPQQPWRRDDLGLGFRIHEGALSKMVTLNAIAIGGTCFISVFVLAITQDTNAPFFVYLVVGFFALVIGLLDCHAIYTTLRYCKYGDPALMLTEWPIATGRPFVGAVLIGRHLEQETGGVKVTLKCERKTTTGSGKHAKTHVEELYCTSTVATRDMGSGSRSAIPFTLPIPDRLPSRDIQSNPAIEWTLKVDAETPGIDFGAEFAVPVYEVADPALIQTRSSAGAGRSGF